MYEITTTMDVTTFKFRVLIWIDTKIRTIDHLHSAKGFGQPVDLGLGLPYEGRVSSKQAHRIFTLSPLSFPHIFKVQVPSYL